MGEITIMSYTPHTHLILLFFNYARVNMELQKLFWITITYFFNIIYEDKPFKISYKFWVLKIVLSISKL